MNKIDPGQQQPGLPHELIPGGGSNTNPNEFGGGHETIFTREGHGHISWDTNNQREYIPGTGHTQDHTSGNIEPWIPG